MLVVCVVCLATAIILTIREKQRIRRERLLMTKLRGSSFYNQLYQMVRFARRRDLDQVRVERGRIIFSAVCPPGKLCEYSVPGAGFRVLSGCRTRVLAEVLGEDIPALKTPMYSLRRYRILRPNGRVDYGYVYTLRQIYKTQLMYERRYATLR